MEYQKEIEQINKFIEHNELDFSGDGSSLNGNCVILAGYLCYLGLEDNDFIKEQLIIDFSNEAEDEFERVLIVAKRKSYGDWWKKPEAKEKYKF